MADTESEALGRATDTYDRLYGKYLRAANADRLGGGKGGRKNQKSVGRDPDAMQVDGEAPVEAAEPEGRGAAALINVNLRHQQLPLQADFPVLAFPRSIVEVHVGYWLNESRVFALNQLLGCCPTATDAVITAIQNEIALEQAEARFLRQVAVASQPGSTTASGGAAAAARLLPYTTSDRILSFDSLLATIVIDHALEELFSHLEQHVENNLATNFFKFYTDWSNRAGALVRFVRDLFEGCFAHASRLRRAKDGKLRKFDLSSLAKELDKTVLDRIEPGLVDNLNNIEQVVRNRIALFRDAKLPKLELANACVRKLALDCNNATLNLFPFVGFLRDLEGGKAKKMNLLDAA